MKLYDVYWILSAGMNREAEMGVGEGGCERDWVRKRGCIGFSVGFGIVLNAC